MSKTTKLLWYTTNLVGFGALKLNVTLPTVWSEYIMQCSYTPLILCSVDRVSQYMQFELLKTGDGAGVFDGVNVGVTVFVGKFVLFGMIVEHWTE